MRTPHGAPRIYWAARRSGSGSGGVGEHQPPIRARAAPGFPGTGIGEQRNQAASSDAGVTAPGAAVHTLVITAREDIEIARQVRAALS